MDSDQALRRQIFGLPDGWGIHAGETRPPNSAGELQIQDAAFRLNRLAAALGPFCSSYPESVFSLT